MLRTLLLELAKSPRLGRWITSNAITRRMAQKFVPGEDLAHAVEAARTCNRAGMTVSLDHLGENVVSREDVVRARNEYTNILDRIADEKLNSNASLKLTQLGLDLGEEYCADQLRVVTRRATELGNFVRVDMEGSAYTDRTLRIVKQARAETDAVGTVIQAYLYRSEKDIQELLEIGCRIRLVKGAYKEPARIAYPRKKQVDDNYIKLMQLLLPSGIYHAIATHDPKMIAATKQFASTRHRQRQVRIPDAVWDSHGSAEPLGARRLSRARLHSVWPGLVSLLHAAAGRATRKFDFLRQEFIPRKSASARFIGI